MQSLAEVGLESEVDAEADVRELRTVPGVAQLSAAERTGVGLNGHVFSFMLFYFYARSIEGKCYNYAFILLIV